MKNKIERCDLLRSCKKCGAALYETDEICPVCKEKNPIDETTENNSSFNLCKILSVVIMVVGTISSIISAVGLNNIFGYSSNYNLPATILITGIVSSFVLSVILFTLGDIQTRLKEIADK